MLLSNLKVRFDHIRTTQKKDKDFTTCEISTNDENQTVLAVGKVWCSKKDNFCKEIGRKKSLKKALKYTELSKSQRAAIWEDYRTSTLHNRWGISK